MRMAEVGKEAGRKFRRCSMSDMLGDGLEDCNANSTTLYINLQGPTAAVGSYTWLGPHMMRTQDDFQIWTWPHQDEDYIDEDCTIRYYNVPLEV